MDSLRLLAPLVSALSLCSIVAIAPPALGADGGSDSGATPGTDGGGLDAASSPAADAPAHRDGAADGATTLPPPAHVVGKGCGKDADCAPGLVCLTVSSDTIGGGGPPGGLCTLDCAANGQADCDRIDTGSACGLDQTRAIAFCYERCTAGPVSPGEHKCHDRADFACAPSRTGTGYCTPTCRGDYECAGRVCEPRSGLCSGTVQGTLPVGSSCNPDVSSTDCIGTCSTLGTSVPTKDNSFCTTLCTIGKSGSCGEAPNAAGPPSAACILKFAPDETEGDLGECAELCDCDRHCKNPGFICSAASVPKDTGRAGACVPKLTFNGVTPGIPCQLVTVPDAGSAPPSDAAAPRADSGATEGPAIAASPTGGCDCRASRSRPEGRSAPALGALLGLAGFRGRRAWRSRRFAPVR